MAGPSLFTVDDVNDLIPRLEALVATLHANARALQTERAAAGHTADGAIPTMDAVVRRRPAARRHVEAIEAAADAIAALGGQLKDLDLGLVHLVAVRQ